MSSWKIDEAKACFTEFVDAALNNGPQILVSEGREVAVLVSVAAWKEVCLAKRPSIKDLLLSPEPRFDNLVPQRRRWRRRKPVNFNEPDE